MGGVYGRGVALFLQRGGVYTGTQTVMTEQEGANRMSKAGDVSTEAGHKRPSHGTSALAFVCGS